MALKIHDCGKKYACDISCYNLLYKCKEYLRDTITQSVINCFAPIVNVYHHQLG